MVRPMRAEGGLGFLGRLWGSSAGVAVLLFAVAGCTALPNPSSSSSPPPGFGPATWALDPTFPPPAADSTELHVLVWETACSSGRLATGRMSAPLLDFAESTVTITIQVRGVTGNQECPLPQGTPNTVRLTEPLGARTLLDGGRDPVGTPAFP